MLVLTRKAGEAIRIGEKVVVRVLGVRGGQVSVGVEAPSEVRVLRDEVAAGKRGNGSDVTLARSAGSGTGADDLQTDVDGPRGEDIDGSSRSAARIRLPRD